MKNREYREKIECFQHSSQKQWVWSSHYLGKSLICGYRTLAGPPACRLRQWRHSSLAATSPISSYSSYCKWINRCFIPRASAQGGSAVFLVISNTRKTLTKKVGSSQTKMETTLLLPMHTCSLPHPRCIRIHLKKVHGIVLIAGKTWQAWRPGPVAAVAQQSTGPLETPPSCSWSAPGSVLSNTVLRKGCHDMLMWRVY